MDIDEAQRFFILGAAKCGTTSLFRYVEQHRDAFLSDPKEPIFFEAQYERGLDFYHRTYFQGWKGERAVGDARAHHLFLPFVAPRIRESFPDARLVAILRDPVDRCLSEWWHRFSRGIETLSLPDALAANVERMESGLGFEGEQGAKDWYRGLRNKRNTATRYGLYLELGHYAPQIERYRTLFPGEQLKILFFDDLARSPDAVTREVWDFLGIDPSHPLDTGTTHNPASGRVRGPWAARLRSLPRPARLRRLVPAPVLAGFRRAVSGRPAQRPYLDAQTEQWLLRHFEPFNRALERLVGRKLDTWFLPDATRRGELEPGNTAQGTKTA